MRMFAACSLLALGLGGCWHHAPLSFADGTPGYELWSTRLSRDIAVAWLGEPAMRECDDALRSGARSCSTDRLGRCTTVVVFDTGEIWLRVTPREACAATRPIDEPPDERWLIAR